MNTSLIYKTCSVFGHSKIEITKELENKLFETFKELITKGCENFYDHIKRIFCLSDPRHLRINKRPKWLKSEDYEEFVYLDLDFDWWYQRIYYRNLAMIDRSDFIVFYVEERENSGAYKAYKYAVKKNKDLLNLK